MSKDIHYDCGSCKHENNSLFKEPCMSCHSDKDRDDMMPTNYEPKDQDCEACKINI